MTRRSAVPAAFLVLMSMDTGGLARSRAENGISVGRPKVYDNRSLAIMLEQLNEQLRTLNTIDQQKILQALAAQQGAEASDVSRSFSITGLSLPSMKTTETTPSEAGKLAVTEQITDRAAVVPSAPTLPELLTPPTYSPSFGLAAQDLLSDQVGLSYQIFNVRMLLERALSDRLLKDKPRLQAVMGFQISLDPPRAARDYAAFVEVTVSSRAGRPSLVALMPFEKTYNSTALHSRSNAFGGSAVVKLITLGYNQRRRQQVFYLFRDTDTLALEYPDMDPGSGSQPARFGWEFRPVLGRRSVSPGIRQMFAVLALNSPDPGVLSISDSEASTWRASKCDRNSPSARQIPGWAPEETLTVTVRTYWRRYDRRTLTTSRPNLMEQSSYSDQELPVHSAAAVQRTLAPQVHKVSWSRTGPDTAAATLEGRNFFAGTRILLGGKTYDSPSSGLLIKSDQVLELRTSAAELAGGDAVISGRYGAMATVEEECEPTRRGLRINDVSFTPEPTRSWTRLRIDVQDREGLDVDLPSNLFLVTVGGQALPEAFEGMPLTCEAGSLRVDTAPPQDTALPKEETLHRGDSPGKDETPREDEAPRKGETRKCLRITADVPMSSLIMETPLGVRLPLLGPKYADTWVVYPPDLITSAVRLSRTKVGITGRGFTEEWRVRVDREYKGKTDLSIEPTLITLELKESVLGEYKHLVVIPEAGPPVLLPLPGMEPEPVVASITSSTPAKVKKDSGASVVFSGTGLQAIKTAKSDSLSLRFRVSAEGRAIQLVLPREATAKPGPAVVVLESGDGSFILAPILVEP